ncbi:MAG: GNAT family N-acetyltransferase [Hyphomicrobiales bacterium]|nr:GNAT family N-acetyltransferase [Hyphomicrobiales bacterium]
MALFRFSRSFSENRHIRGEGVYLRPPAASDFRQWAALREASRAFLVPWEPLWPADDLTRTAFRRRLRRQEEELLRDETYPFFLFRNTDDELLGGLTLGQIRRGVAQTGTLGYWMGEPYAGKGYMSRAVRAVCRYGFSTLQLHRIEAACLLHNDASQRVLDSCGFKREGHARAYLRINGQWQDHILFALLDSDPVSPPASRAGAGRAGA